jgi:hypothetical protein
VTPDPVEQALIAAAEELNARIANCHEEVDCPKCGAPVGEQCRSMNGGAGVRRWPIVAGQGGQAASGAVDSGGAGAMKVNVDHDVPIPRLIALLSPGGEGEPTWLTLGVELSTTYGEAVVRVEVDLDWKRPRPWQCEAWWPPKHGLNHFRWRRPRGG